MKSLRPILVFLLLCAGVELAVRATLPEVTPRAFFLEWFGDPPEAPHPGQVSVFAGDPDTLWRLRSGLSDAIWDFTVVTTNEDGLRRRRPVGPKPPGGFRILAVGDSVTFGYRIPLVFPDVPDAWDRNSVPYPDRMEGMLRAANPTTEVEAVSLAVPGFSSHQGRIMLSRWLDRVEPDVVVLCFGFNDSTPRPRRDAELMAMGATDRALRRLVVSSQTLLHLIRWRWSWGGGGATAWGGEPVLRVPADEYVQNLLVMAGEAARAGAVPVILAPVFRDTTTDPGAASRIAAHRAALAAAAEETGVLYLAIPELLETGAPANERLFGEHIHPSDSGHELMAIRLLDFLRDHGALHPLRRLPER